MGKIGMMRSKDKKAPENRCFFCGLVVGYD